MIPFMPEPLDRLRARYAEAIRPVFDPESMLLGVQEMPGETRRNVFDAEDGLRLIISRDAIPRPTLHLSASLCPNTDAWHRYAALVRRQGLGSALDQFRSDVERRFRAVSDEARPLTYLGVLGAKGVPHWVLEESRP